MFTTDQRSLVGVEHCGGKSSVGFDQGWPAADRGGFGILEVDSAAAANRGLFRDRVTQDGDHLL